MCASRSLPEQEDVQIDDFIDLMRKNGSPAIHAEIADAEEVQQEEPLPLFREDESSEKVPIDAPCPLLREVTEALHRSIQAPPLPLCANSVLAAAALGAQAHPDVCLPFGAGQRRPLGFILISIARSGERKTAVANEVLAVVSLHEEVLRARAKSEHEDYECEQAVWEKARTDILANKNLAPIDAKQKIKARGPKPEPPARYRVIELARSDDTLAVHCKVRDQT